MTADKMFEELGYEINYKDKWTTEYYKDGKIGIYILFRNKKFEKSNEYSQVEGITIPELKAINEKVKELGWYD